MPVEHGAAFRHRQNKSGTIDSICLLCFSTVARGLKTEAQLTKCEEQHVCHSDFLAERGMQLENLAHSARIIYEHIGAEKAEDDCDRDDAIGI